jgi:hypothetical protein
MSDDKKGPQPAPSAPSPKGDGSKLPPPPAAPVGRIVKGGVIGDRGWKGGGGGGVGGKK